MLEINLDWLIGLHFKQFFCLGMNLCSDPSRWQVKTSKHILKYHKVDLIWELPFKTTAPKWVNCRFNYFPNYNQKDNLNQLQPITATVAEESSRWKD